MPELEITEITTIEEWKEWDKGGTLSHPAQYANRWFEQGELDDIAVNAAADFWGKNAPLVVARVADAGHYLVPAVWVPYLLDGTARLAGDPRSLIWHGVRVTHRALVAATLLPDQGMRDDVQYPNRDE